MISIKVDIAAAMAGLKNIQQNQIPYATSRALNDVADMAVNDLVSWVKTAFNFRGSSSWVRYRWFRSRWSTKTNLVAFVDGLMNYLLLHERGGIRLPHSRPTLCIPLGDLRRRRIPPQLRPSFLLGNDFAGLLKTTALGVRTRRMRMASWSKGFILQVGGRRYIAMRGTNAGVPMTAKRLQGVSLLYHLVPSAKIPPRLRMFEIVKAAAGREFAGAFARRMTEAMRTAR